MHATLNTINSAGASLIVSWNFTRPVTSCPRIDPHLRFGSIRGHDVTGLVKFQKPSSPRQPPEFDMTLQIFLPHLRFGSENLEGHVKFWGLQRTTWPMLHIHPLCKGLLIIEFSYCPLQHKKYEKYFIFVLCTSYPYINLAVVCPLVRLIVRLIIRCVFPTDHGSAKWPDLHQTFTKWKLLSPKQIEYALSIAHAHLHPECVKTWTLLLCLFCYFFGTVFAPTKLCLAGAL